MWTLLCTALGTRMPWTWKTRSPSGFTRPRRSRVRGLSCLRLRVPGVRGFVFVSSVKAMGEGGEACLDERSGSRPSSSYGRAKREAEGDVLEWGQGGGRHAAVVRLPLVYGPYAKGNLARLIASIHGGWFPPLPEVHNRRSMIHVEDAAAAVLAAVQRAPASGRLYLATDGQCYSTVEICDAIRLALGRRPPRWSVPFFALRTAARVG